MPGIHFAGTITMGAAGLKKNGVGGHRARSTARATTRASWPASLAERHFGVERPREPVAPGAVVDRLLEEASDAPELWNQKGYLARVILAGPDGPVDDGIVPLQAFVDGDGPDGAAMTLEGDADGLDPAGRLRPAAGRDQRGHAGPRAAPRVPRLDRRAPSPVRGAAGRAALTGSPSAPPTRRTARRLAGLDAELIACRACPRLVEWRERVAREKVARFRDREYWAKPVPGFGDIDARILLVGLAPGAHGSNRTGRMFTGDGSGNFLYAALHAVGLASQSHAHERDDGMVLADARITAVVRCAPPANKPTPVERDRCLPYVTRELALLDDVRVIVGLGSFGWDGALRAVAANGLAIPRPRPRFGHGVEAHIGRYVLLGTFHPSQQNTFTGKLTPPMLEAVLRRAIELASGEL